MHFFDLQRDVTADNVFSPFWELALIDIVNL